MWKRNVRRAYCCSFCGKTQDQVQRLIAGPGGAYVCDECIMSFRNGKGRELQSKQGLRCSFCGKSQDQVQYLASGLHGIHICSECVDLCQDIIDEECRTVFSSEGRVGDRASKRREEGGKPRRYERVEKPGRKVRAYICSFCGKSQNQVRRLIAGPGGIFVCNECVAIFINESAQDQREQKGLRCSFCGKSQQQIRHLTSGTSGVHICNECVNLCQEIIEEETRFSQVYLD